MRVCWLKILAALNITELMARIQVLWLIAFVVSHRGNKNIIFTIITAPK